MVAALALSSCVAPSKAPSPPPPANVVETPAPAPPLAPKPSPPVAPPTPKDSCGAEELKYLIGKPRTDIPVPLDPSRRRVVCSECMVTQDFVSSRVTIVYNSITGLVTSIRCG